MFLWYLLHRHVSRNPSTKFSSLIFTPRRSRPRRRVVTIFLVSNLLSQRFQPPRPFSVALARAGGNLWKVRISGGKGNCCWEGWSLTVYLLKEQREREKIRGSTILFVFPLPIPPPFFLCSLGRQSRTADEVSMLSIGYTQAWNIACAAFPTSEGFHCGIRVLVTSLRWILHVRKNFSPPAFYSAWSSGTRELLRWFERPWNFTGNFQHRAERGLENLETVAVFWCKNSGRCEILSRVSRFSVSGICNFARETLRSV